MQLKAVVESTLAGIVVAVFSYFTLISPATLAALAVRRRMPAAWFSSSIVWYATGAVLIISFAIAAVACRMVYRHIGEKDSKESKA